MNRLYPLFLKLSGRSCVVVGGGDVAEQKVKSLLPTGAQITVISPKTGKVLNELDKQGRINIIRRKFKKEDLLDAFIIIVATNSPSINSEIAKEARLRGILCNVVDDPSSSDFYMPSVFNSGDLKIAISTNGKSPALARKLKEEMEELYGEYMDTAIDNLSKLRECLKEKVPDFNRRKKIYISIISSQTFYKYKNNPYDFHKSLQRIIEEWL